MRVHNFKYRKVHKVKVKKGSFDYKRLQLLYGSIGLRSLSEYRLKAVQIESCRRAIKKVVKKLGNVWIRVSADRPITSKPAEVRMGKGKGNYSYSVAIVNKGTILFELSGPNLNVELAKEALKQGAERLPFKTEICFYKS